MTTMSGKSSGASSRSGSASSDATNVQSVRLNTLFIARRSTIGLPRSEPVPARMSGVSKIFWTVPPRTGDGSKILRT